MRRYMRRTFVGALAISTDESLIGTSPTNPSRGCQSASAAGSLKPQWNWALYLRPRGSHFGVRHAQTDTVSTVFGRWGKCRRRWSAAAGRPSRSDRAPVPRRSSAPVCSVFARTPRMSRQHTAPHYSD
jgi:hypothetical protein